MVDTNLAKPPLNSVIYYTPSMSGLPPRPPPTGSGIPLRRVPSAPIQNSGRTSSQHRRSASDSTSFTFCGSIDDVFEPTAIESWINPSRNDAPDQSPPSSPESILVMATTESSGQASGDDREQLGISPKSEASEVQGSSSMSIEERHALEPIAEPDDEESIIPEVLEKTSPWHKNRTLLIWLLLLVVLIIVGGTVGGVLAASNNNESKSSDIENPTPSPLRGSVAPTNLPSFSVVNEACRQAIGPLIVNQPPIQGSTVSESVVSLGCGGISADGFGIWYSIVGGDEVLRASTCESAQDVDTRLFVYGGRSCEALQCISANDQFCGNRSSASWLARKGETYYVQVVTSSPSNFTLTVGYESNGECDTHIPVAVNEAAIVGSTKATNRTVNVLTCDFIGAEDGAVWYSVVGTGSWMQASTCHPGITQFNARLNTLLDNCRGCQAFRDSSCGSGSLISWKTELDIEYRILVFKSDLRQGTVFGLDVSEFDPVSNDNCLGAEFLELGTAVDGSTMFATSDESTLRSDCLNGLVSHPGVWYRVRGTGDRLLASTCDDATNFGSKVSIYTGTCGQPVCVSTLEEQSCDGKGSVYWDSVDGMDYFVFVHGDGSLGDNEVGDFRLTVDVFATEANDECINAIEIGGLGNSFKGSNFAATFEDTPTCDAVRSLAPGVWFTVKLAQTTNLRASTCDPETSFDTQLTVYRGDCDTLSCVVTDDNGCGFQSSVVWQALANVQYYIFVHGRFPSSTGDFSLSVEEYSPQVPNDFCDDAIIVDLDETTVVGSTLTATFDNVGSCNGVEDTAPGVWYQLQGTGTNMEASLCRPETTFNTALSVFVGTCTELKCIAASDDSPGCAPGASLVSWMSNPDLNYFIFVHGFASRTGDFGLLVTEPEPVMANDFCVTAQNLIPSDTSISGSTIGATLDEAPICTNVKVSKPGVWYTVTGTGGRLIASTCDSPGDLNTQISVFTGSCGSLSCVFADDNGCFIKSRVVFETTRGSTYYILVHDASTVTGGGDFELVVDNFVPQQPNDYCASAQQVSADGTPVQGSTIGASFDDTGFCGTSVTGLGVWYLVLGTGELLRADTCSFQTTYDTKISVFTGSCNNLECIDGNDDGCGLRSSITFPTEGGKLYWILVHGVGTNRAGNFDLEVSGSFFLS